jgi:ferredoxin-NADP reductase
VDSWNVLRVAGVRREGESALVVRVDLAGARYSYSAGQAALIGPAGARERVAYSIASSPEDSARLGFLEFLVKVDGAGRWGEHFPPLARGASLSVSAARGRFVFPERPAERRFLFIAGGTGIAPLRSMIRHARARRAGTLSLLYSARTPGDFAFLREFRALVRSGRLELALTATRETTPRWPGGRGRIAEAQLAPLVHDPATLCFVCGPETMVDAVPPMLKKLGIPGRLIRLEEW